MIVGLLSKLGDWKFCAMIAMGIIITILLGVVGYLSYERSELKEEIGEKNLDIANLKRDIDKLVVSLQESEKSVKTLKDNNDSLIEDMKKMREENMKNLATQKKLLNKITSLEKKTVTPSKSNPSQPIEHFYFDQEMVELINHDILEIKEKGTVGPPAPTPSKK